MGCPVTEKVAKWIEIRSVASPFFTIALPTKLLLIPGLCILPELFIVYPSDILSIRKASKGGIDMIAKTTQWGNSIGVRIPRSLARKAGIDVNSTVEIDEADEGVIIKSVRKKEYSLKELVKGITPQNRHGEIDFGLPAGKELI